MTATITYRKTRQGEWAAMIPLAGYPARTADGTLLRCTIQVAKRDGTTESRVITRYGKPFTTAGGEMVYAYLAPRATRPARQWGMDFSEYADGHGRGEM